MAEVSVLVVLSNLLLFLYVMFIETMSKVKQVHMAVAQDRSSSNLVLE